LLLLVIDAILAHMVQTLALMKVQDDESKIVQSVTKGHEIGLRHRPTRYGRVAPAFVSVQLLWQHKYEVSFYLEH
jgi:hypothetical protein